MLFTIADMPEKVKQNLGLAHITTAYYQIPSAPIDWPIHMLSRRKIICDDLKNESKLNTNSGTFDKNDVTFGWIGNINAPEEIFSTKKSKKRATCRNTY